MCSGCHDDAEPDAAGPDARAEPEIASSGQPGLDIQFLTPPSAGKGKDPAAMLPAQASNPAAAVVPAQASNPGAAEAPAQASNPAGCLATQVPLQGEFGEQKALFDLQVENDIQKEADALTQALQARAEAKDTEAEAAEEPDEPKPAMKKPAAGKPKAKGQAKAACKPGWQVEVRTRGDGKQTDKYYHAPNGRVYRTKGEAIKAGYKE